MKSILLFSTLFFLVPVGAMEKEEIQLKDMPEEIKVQIISEITQANTIEQAIKSIRALAVTSAEFNRLINDQMVTQEILNNLVKRFPRETAGNLLYAAIALDTSGAKDWLKDKRWLEQITTAEFLNNANTELIKTLLLNPQITRNKLPDGNYFFIKAAESGRIRLIKMLLEAGVDSNVQDNNGVSALLQVIQADLPPYMK